MNTPNWRLELSSSVATTAQPENRTTFGSEFDAIRLRGVRTHNLKNVDLDIPHNQLTVITGVSGSGKSSLAFDTIFAEGQRQYIDSLSVYARQFVEQMQRPDADIIEGLQPTLCIDQRNAMGNPRSTVATVTEIYDYLRLLMTRLGTPHCFACGQAIVQQSSDQILSSLRALPDGTRLVILAPVVRGRPGAHRDAIESIRKAGLVKVRVDNELYDIEQVPTLAVRKKHTIEAVIDKVILREHTQVDAPSPSMQRVIDAVRLALQLADGLVSVSYLIGPIKEDGAPNDWHERLFSTRYSCANCGVSYEELEPRTFSFNSPYGACPTCQGMGTQAQFDPDSIVVDWNVSPAKGAFLPWQTAPAKLKTKLKQKVVAQLESLGGAWDQPLSSLKSAARKQFLTSDHSNGLLNELQAIYLQAEAKQDESVLSWLNSFRQELACPACEGSRLRREAMSVTVDNHNIHQICSKSIREVLVWVEALQYSESQEMIAQPIITPMLHRLRFLEKVGLGYLTLSRGADTLSGGELQRVRLASSIGSGLVGVCYVLDEPSIGLHQHDNDRLIESLRDLQSQGNTVIVVEHDEAMMQSADVLIDIGPGAGSRGGHVIAMGTPSQVTKHPDSITAQYLRGERAVNDRTTRRKPTEQAIELVGVNHHNLRNVSIRVPVGLLIGVTGVSGSGKSSLIVETLAPAIQRALGQAARRPGKFQKLLGTENVDKLIEINQESIGRTPRSTPATYCGVFDLIRTVFSSTSVAKQRGYSSSRFSFNTGDGRCKHCMGQGQEKIEMNFLADTYVTCSECGGARYNRQTLQVRYKDKSIADVLAMSFDEAAVFFENFSKIHRLLDSMVQVGLGYLSMGQSSTTLSGGEAQRIKLATELARAETGRTIYFMDEPTTGLHFEDCRRLLNVLDGLVDRGNTVIVIEHNLDIIRACDWLIDLGQKVVPVAENYWPAVHRPLLRPILEA